MSVWRASDTSDRESQPAARSIHSMSHQRSASALRLSSVLSDEHLHRLGSRPRVPPWPLHAGGRSFLQESRVRFASASQRVPPCPRGAESLSHRRGRGYIAPIRTPAPREGQPSLLEQPPSGGLPPALRLHGSCMSTYPAQGGAATTCTGVANPRCRSCQWRPQPLSLPFMGGWYFVLGSPEGVEIVLQGA